MFLCMLFSWFVCVFVVFLFSMFWFQLFGFCLLFGVLFLFFSLCWFAIVHCCVLEVCLFLFSRGGFFPSTKMCFVWGDGVEGGYRVFIVVSRVFPTQNDGRKTVDSDEFPNKSEIIGVSTFIIEKQGLRPWCRRGF